MKVKKRLSPNYRWEPFLEDFFIFLMVNLAERRTIICRSLDRHSSVCNDVRTDRATSQRSSHSLLLARVSRSSCVVWGFHTICNRALVVKRFAIFSKSWTSVAASTRGICKNSGIVSRFRVIVFLGIITPPKIKFCFRKSPIISITPLT